MTLDAPVGGQPLFDSGSDDERFPILDQAVLDELAEFGTVREVDGGEVLYRAGAEVWDLFVILEGEFAGDSGR